MPRRQKRQPVQTPTGQPYGEAQAQEQQQQAAPLIDKRALFQQAMQAAQAAPGVEPDFAAPSQRPNEPITAGLPMGAGPGVEALGVAQPFDLDSYLRLLYRAYPHEEIRQLIEKADEAGYDRERALPPATQPEGLPPEGSPPEFAPPEGEAA